MKNFKIQLFLSLLAVLFTVTGCEDGIDPITAVDPGTDEFPPEVFISSPVEGATIKVLEEVSSIDISFSVEDDIEIASITVSVDGNQIASMSNFKDYRIVNETVTFNNVTNGDHTVAVTATDVVGESTTETVNFSKEAPYTPRFAGELLYMPFDGDFLDLVNLKGAETEGSPGFTEDAFFGSRAFMSATDSYLSYPLESGGFGSEFSAAFWYKVSGSPDRAGILVAGDDADNRFQGFRLFREGSADEQRLKLNVGTGTGEVWNDGGVIDVNAGEWVHVAFTVNAQETVIYLNGMPVNTGNMMGNTIDWTGVNELTIGAGGETFSYWGHLSDSSPMDELRFFNRALTAEEVQDMINASAVTLYLPFEGNYSDMIANKEVTTVGSPGFAGEASVGTNAYAGAADSYLTLPADGLKSQELSGTFWYKVSASPDRAGILVMGPPDTENAGFPETQNLRTSGFRLFREGSATEQRIKLNVGTGDAESWNDGGVIDATAGDWVHVGFTISTTQSTIYINGEAVNTGTLLTPIIWDGVDILSVMSGAPRFTGWSHLSDQSYMDELRLYNKVLTPEEIQESMAN